MYNYSVPSMCTADITGAFNMGVGVVCGGHVYITWYMVGVHHLPRHSHAIVTTVSKVSATWNQRLTCGLTMHGNPPQHSHSTLNSRLKSISKGTIEANPGKERVMMHVHSQSRQPLAGDLCHLGKKWPKLGGACLLSSKLQLHSLALCPQRIHLPQRRN